MKYLAIIATLLLVGCGNYDSAESLGIHIGKTYTVQHGFYKGCTGIATDYSDYNSIDDTVRLDNVTCNNTTMNFIRTEAKNLRK